MPDTAVFASDHRPAEPIWKVDRFSVPEAEVPAFLAILNDTHRLLESLDGFLWQAVLMEPASLERTGFVTAVAWRDEAAFTAARARVRAWQAQRGFTPASYIAAHGIAAELGLYRSVPDLCSAL